MSEKPELYDISIAPISSDTLKIKLNAPPNGTSGLTGMKVISVSGSGGTSSTWTTGSYTYLDGGLNPSQKYIYKVIFRNGDGDSTAYSQEKGFQMNGLDTLTVYLGGDTFDDYNINGGAGCRDSTVVRAGTSDTGQKLDGFLSFELPWQVHKGGVDSIKLSMTRNAEAGGTSPVLKARALRVKDINPVETLNLAAQDTSAANISWTVTSGAGVKQSPNLRSVFREWQDLIPSRDRIYGFGLKLDDNVQASGTRAVFLDRSNVSYSNGTYLTIIYTPGAPDSLDRAPSGFILSQSGPDSLIASWSDNSAYELGYVIMNWPELTRVTAVDTLAENTTSARIGGLVPNTLYNWCVRAFGAANDSTSGNASSRTLGADTRNYRNDNGFREFVENIYKSVG